MRIHRHQHAVDAVFGEHLERAQIRWTAERDFQGRRIAARFPRRGAGQFDQIEGIAARRKEAVAQASGATRRRLGVAADVDGHRALGRPRAAIGAVEAHETALERRSLLAPQRAQHGDVLVGARRSVLEGCADGLELFLQPADADAEQHAPAGHHVERRHLLGGDHRAVLGQDENAGAELDGLGAGGDVGHPDQRIGQRKVEHAAGHAAIVRVRILGCVALGHHRVLDRPSRLEAGLLGRLHEFHGKRAVHEAPGVAVAQPEFHPVSLVAPSSQRTASCIC